ncbi:MAG: hypothetical protein HY707_01250 [Ignavibacteriae bacterium]|nr:hypothetical protein [Ignavibacteriota bacterium]
MDKQKLSEEYLQLEPKDQEELHDLAVRQRQKAISDQKSMLMDDSDELPPEEDKFNRHPVAEIIAHRIVSDDKIRTYSIDGPWGSGKSVLIKWVNKELKEKYSDKVVTIWFEPWKYESVGNIIFPLIEKMKKEVEGRDFDEQVDKVLKGVLILGGAAIAWQYLGTKSAIPLLKLLLENKVKKLEKETKKLSELQKDFQKLVDDILGAWQSNPQKLVFLIDDLDRCSPDNALLLLESVKNFLNTKNTCFVFAIDRRVVSQGIKVKYGGSLTDIDGNEYLEKIIQFSYELPFDVKYAAFQLLRLYEKSSERNLGNLDFAPELFRLLNIRSIRFMKKVYNRFVVIHELGSGTYGGSFNPQILFFITLLYEFSPRFYQRMEEARPNHPLWELKNTSYESLDVQNSKLPFTMRGILESIPETKLIKLSVDSFLNSEVLGKIPDDRDRQQKMEKFNNDLLLCMDIFSRYGIKQTDTEKALK